MFDVYGEGVNGQYYNEELDFAGEYHGKKRGRFIRDPYFYHVPLFASGDDPRIEHATTKGILFSTRKGRFWVPKKLIKRKGASLDNWVVHYKFNRGYLPGPVDPKDLLG